MTASEISALLRTGHATGANARWRTLHELAVVTTFLAEHGQEVVKRYLEHQTIEAHKRAAEYQRHCQSFGSAPLDPDEIEGLRRARGQLATRYGQNYTNQHGCAAEVLNKANPSFAEIEESIDMAHWRPYVGIALHGVHAGPRGAYFDLGLAGLDAIPAGPSQFGLADPGANSLKSLLLGTLPLLVHGLELTEANPALIVHGTVLITQMKILQGLVEKGAEAFLSAHAIEEDSEPQIREPPRMWRGPEFEG